MSIAAAAVSLLLAALLAYSAIRKLSHDEEVVASYARAGVPEAWLNTLASLLLAAAAVLVAGIAWAPAGIAAAGALIPYFLVAIGFHLRARDFQQLPTPLVMEVLSVAALALRLAA